MAHFGGYLPHFLIIPCLTLPFYQLIDIRVINIQILSDALPSTSAFKKQVTSAFRQPPD